jgi:Domain of unknown function (DUF4062)
MSLHPTNIELTGRPAFVSELREWALEEFLIGDDTRFQLVLDRDDHRTLFVSFQDATRWVWHLLHQLPEAVAGGSDALFILGFNPSAAGHYQANDMLPLLLWHQCLARLFQWSIARNTRVGAKHVRKQTCRMPSVNSSLSSRRSTRCSCRGCSSGEPSGSAQLGREGFISSVIVGLESLRAVAREAAELFGAEVIEAERFPARAPSPRKACLHEARDADAIILIRGGPYGEPLVHSRRAPAARHTWRRQNFGPASSVSCRWRIARSTRSGYNSRGSCRRSTMRYRR